MKILSNIMSGAVLILFIMAVFLTTMVLIPTAIQAQTCETRCISKDLVTGECNAWQTTCWD